MNLFKKCLAEFIGTFGLVMAGCGAIAADQISGGDVTHVGIALTFGLIIAAMIYSTGHISGAHLNPAVTLAFSVTRHFPAKEILPYITAQTLGAVSASFIHDVTLTPILHQRMAGAVLNLGVTLPADGRFMTALVWEILLTFFLMFVIMAVATDHRAIGKAAPLAIGATVALGAMFAGPICGASMNPARSFAPALVSGQWQHLGAYILGPVCGALSGALAYQLIRCSPSQNSAKGCC